MKNGRNPGSWSNMVNVASRLARYASLIFIFSLWVPAVAAAQVPSADSLEQWVRSGYTLTAQDGKPADFTDRIRDVWGELGWSGIGYGFRTFSARRSEPDPDTEAGITTFARLMDHYRITLDDLKTSVTGDIGLVWGIHTEDFKMKGRPPERVRVRFTNTLRWDGKQWRSLLYHRDAQVFDGKGWYVAESPPTVIVFVRHANVDLTQPTVPLNADGHARASSFATAVSAIPFSHVLASHTTRAREMVEPVSKRLRLAVQQFPAPGTRIDTTIVSDRTPSRLAAVPLVEALRQLPRGSTALVGVNSDNVYAIMNGLGVRTSTADHPCSPGETCVPCVSNACAERRYDQYWILSLSGDSRPSSLMELRY